MIQLVEEDIKIEVINETVRERERERDNKKEEDLGVCVMKGGLKD